MKVAEVWRYRDETVHFYGLMQNGRYRKLKRSRLFPFLTSDDLTRYLALRDTMDDTELEFKFEKWVRNQLKATHEPTFGKLPNVGDHNKK